MALKPDRGIPLAEEQYWTLVGRGDWSVHEVPQDLWPKLPSFMAANDALGVMASGSLDREVSLNGLSAVGGVDWLRHESKPKANGPEGNAYHFVIVRQSDDSLRMYGHYKTETVVDHWFEADDLNRYF